MAGMAANNDIEQYVHQLSNPATRENALLELSKKRENFPELAPYLWYSFGTVAALLQEIVSIYPLLTPPSLTAHASNRVCNALALLQCVASHPETRGLFLQGEGGGYGDCPYNNAWVPAARAVGAPKTVCIWELQALWSATVPHAYPSPAHHTRALLHTAPVCVAAVAAAHVPLFLYPFLNTVSKTRPFEYLRLTSLGVIGALVKVDDTDVINFLLSTEIIPLCLRTMEMGSELSKTVATFIVQKILLDDVSDAAL